MGEITSNQRQAIEALAGGATNEQAAIYAGVTERTIYKWRLDPAFSQALTDASGAILSDTIRALTASAISAVETLKTIAEDQTEKGSTRVSAARAILESTIRLKEAVEFEKRLATLEGAINEIKTEQN